MLGPRVGHLGIFDIGIFPLCHLIPLKSDKKFINLSSTEITQSQTNHIQQ